MAPGRPSLTASRIKGRTRRVWLLKEMKIVNSGRSEGRTWDKEIGGSINEKLDVGVRMSSKWNMENHIMCIVGQGINL